MLELNQFRHSAFCLKVRMVLAAKGLDFRTIEITPGIGQLTIFRLSGQRKVPVLVDENNIINDSYEIIRYLENLQPHPRLIPEDPQEAAIADVFENWADTTLANATRTALIKSISKNPNIFTSLLPKDIPDTVSNLINKFPTQLMSELSDFINTGEEAKLLHNLKNITKLIKANHWLVGNSLSIADIAVSAQLSLLKFPESAGKELAGKGCAGFSDNPELAYLFDWRDRLETDLGQSSPEAV